MIPEETKGPGPRNSPPGHESRREPPSGAAGGAGSRSGAEAPRETDGTLHDGVVCPFCSGADTELLSPFGGQLSVAQYWCRRCRTGFDYMKWS